MTQPSIFISYSSSDAGIAMEIAKGLQGRGLEVWIDRERVALGDSVPTNLSSGLERADIVLLLLSKHFVASNWCRAEYESALIKEIDTGKKCILTVLLDDCAIPSFLKAKRHFDLRHRSFDQLPDGPRQRWMDILFHEITGAISSVRINSLVQSALPSYYSSLISIIISKTIRMFPPTVLCDAELISGRSSLELVQTVEAFIDRFIDLVSQLVPPLQGTNRKLMEICRDMRDLADAIDNITASNSAISDKFRLVGQICAQIYHCEDTVVVQLGAPLHLIEPGADDFFGVDHNALPLPFTAVSDYKELSQLLDELSRYKNSLQHAVARLIAKADA